MTDGLFELVCVLLGACIFASIGLLFLSFVNIANDFAENKFVRILMSCFGISMTVIIWGAGLVFLCVKLFDVMKLIL